MSFIHHSFHSGELLQPSDHLHCPPLGPLQLVHIFLVLEALDLDTLFQVWPHKGQSTARHAANRSPDLFVCYFLVLSLHLKGQRRKLQF